MISSHVASLRSESWKPQRAFVRPQTQTYNEMTTPNPGMTREAFKRLRSACQSFEERLTLGEAIRNGWTAPAIEAAAGMYSGRGAGDLKYRLAIQDCSKRTYYSPEDRAADEARLAARQAEEDARAAITITRGTMPVPPEFKAIRAACRNMLDCDRLSAALEAGWLAKDINFLARQFCWVATRHRVEMKETPSAIRFTLEMIQGRPGGHYSPYLPRNKKN